MRNIFIIYGNILPVLELFSCVVLDKRYYRLKCIYSTSLCRILDKVEGYKAPTLSSTKLLNSGFRFKYGLDGMFDEALQCCKEKGYLN